MLFDGWSSTDYLGLVALVCAGSLVSGFIQGFIKDKTAEKRAAARPTTVSGHATAGPYDTKPPKQ